MIARCCVCVNDRLDLVTVKAKGSRQGCGQNIGQHAIQSAPSWSSQTIMASKAATGSMGPLSPPPLACQSRRVLSILHSEIHPRSTSRYHLSDIVASGRLDVRRHDCWLVHVYLPETVRLLCDDFHHHHHHHRSGNCRNDHFRIVHHVSCLPRPGRTLIRHASFLDSDPKSKISVAVPS
jgi:hypothetical protein